MEVLRLRVAETCIRAYDESLAHLTAVGRQTGFLAYKFIAGDTASWKLGVVTEIVDSWTRGEIVNTSTVSDTRKRPDSRALALAKEHTTSHTEAEKRKTRGFRDYGDNDFEILVFADNRRTAGAV